jgi:Immunity protein 50
VLRIINRESLEERFGCWPSFHDAEILAVRLDSGQVSSGPQSVELDIHVFGVDGVLPDGRSNFVLHTLATLRFERVEAVELDGFGPQNVLDELVFEDLGPGWTARLGVALPSNNGLSGSFRCEQIIVIGAEPFEPGPRSVYHRSDD